MRKYCLHKISQTTPKVDVRYFEMPKKEEPRVFWLMIYKRIDKSQKFSIIAIIVYIVPLHSFGAHKLWLP